jgi:hypothetical protein
MAVRLHMKLGVVSEQDRLPDSPDTVVVVEPTVSGIARSKGQLYLLVTARKPARGVAEATRVAAETIRNEYYYDESAGIKQCLQKTVASVNNRLHHQRDRLGLSAHDRDGPLGIAVAVVRGNELYVATFGPAEAYLIRHARLSTLPDPNRERGLPARDLAVEVWRGEINAGDSLVLISPNVVARVGLDELKDALVTLHPQSAIEHLHSRFVTAGGTGSDGAVAFEATEMAATQSKRTLVPVRAPEPLAGAPDRSPIPLADPVAGGVAAMQSGARNASVAAGNGLTRVVFALQELLPRRNARYRRVTPLSARRERQRRAAVAILAFIVVASGLGLGVFLLGGQQPRGPLSSITAGQRSLNTARQDVDTVFGPGIDLVANDPPRAKTLLMQAYSELDKASASGVSAAAIQPLRAQVVAGLDRLYRVVPIVDNVILDLQATNSTPVDLRAVVQGPDGLPYVLEASTKAVYRVDAKAKKVTTTIRDGSKVAGLVVATPKLLTVGGSDLLIVDSKNTVWRWRPADKTGRGTPARVRVGGSSSWGDDITAIGTFLLNQDTNRYRLYVIDPSERQILVYSMAADGAGFPGDGTGWLKAPRPTAGMTAMHIDGDVFVVDGGKLARFVQGNPVGWTAKPPGDELLRPAPTYSLVTSGSASGVGALYAYDHQNERVVAFDKGSGSYREQYVIAGGGAGFADVRGMYVLPPLGQAPATLVWVDAHAVHQAALVPAPTASPSGSAEGSAGPSGAGSTPAASSGAADASVTPGVSVSPST